VGHIACNSVKTLRHRIGLILLVWVLGSALAVGVTLLVKRCCPRYTSTVLIRVESVRPENPFNPWEERPMDRETTERSLGDQISLIRDPDLLNELLVMPEVRNDTEWFKPFAHNVDKARADIERHLVTRPVRGSNLLEVSFSTPDPKDARKIVNALADRYLKRVHGWALRMFANDAEAFDSALRLKEDELNTVKLDIRELEPNGLIPAMAIGAPTMAARLASLQDECVRRESEMTFLRTRYRTYADATPEKLQTNPEILARVEANEKVLQALQRVNRLKDKRDDFLISSGAQDPKITEIDKRLVAAEEDLARMRQSVFKEERDSLVESHRVPYLVALQACTELRESLATTARAQLDLDKNLRRHDELVRQRDTLDRDRDRLAQQHQALLLSIRTQEPARISIFRRATEPLEPSRPQPKTWIPVGSALGLLMGVLLALVLGGRKEESPPQTA